MDAILQLFMSETVSVFFGKFDFFVLFLILIFNLFYYYNIRIIKLHTSIYILFFIIIILIIPYVSGVIEARNAVKLNGIVDGFNLVYCFFRFPIWWLIGFGELIIIQTILHFKLKNLRSN